MYRYQMARWYISSCCTHVMCVHLQQCCTTSEQSSMNEDREIHRTPFYSSDKKAKTTLNSSFYSSPLAIELHILRPLRSKQ